MRELEAVYAEVARAALEDATGQAPRVLFAHAATSPLALVAESLGPRTQRKTGIPWVLPSGKLSDKGELLDRELLRPLGFTADPHDGTRRHAYLTDVSHLWLGRTPSGGLRRPTQRDKTRCAPWLERELQAVRPTVVILLGRHAAPFFLARYSEVRARKLDDVLAKPIVCQVGDLRTTAIPTYHPTGAQCAAGGASRAYADTLRVIADQLTGSSTPRERLDGSASGASRSPGG